MAYVGQGIKNGTFSVLDTSGNTYNGSNTTFNLGTQVGSPAQLLVSHDGVIQKPVTDYTIATGGTQITFTTAPASGASIFITEISGAVGGPMNRDINGDELILDADADTSITADTDDQIDVRIAGTDVVNITNSSSDVVITQAVQDKDIIFKGNDGGSAITALTIDMSDAGILNIKSGIGFPATQVASTGANVLDDYEEGTFQIGITAASGSVTMNSSEDTMQYTKIGRLVFIAGRVDVSSVSSPSGSLSITGLPFTVGALAENADMASFSFYGNALTGSIGNLQGISIPSGTTIQVNEFTGTTAANAGDHIAAGTDFAIGGFYST